jgi:hypothetical protein
MNTFYRWMACLFSLAALGGPAVADPAIGYRLSGPVVQDNLAVYFVRGGDAGAAPLTLDQAMRGGQARVRWTASDPITVENLSDRSIYVPFGTLLTGGLQDQVVSTSFILPPHSGPVSLATYCVDPFRSTARDGEAADRLAAPGELFPGRMAKLAMLVAAPKSRAIRRMRQTAIWWGIDSTRAQLSDSLGTPVEPPRETHWSPAEPQDQVSNTILAGRQSTWRTSLPLALENRGLIEAQHAYVNRLEGAGDATGSGAGNILGAVFAVNGRLDGAEIYQSHALFAAMWPQLLRAHATEAIAANGHAADAPPALETVEAFLASAQAGAARKTAPSIVLRDSAAAIYLETSDRGGAWVNRSFVATAYPAEAAGSPEAKLLGMLESGQVDDQVVGQASGHVDVRPIASLGDRDTVVLRRDANREGWTTAIERLEADPFDAMLGGVPAAVISLAFFVLLLFVNIPRPRTRHSRFVSRFDDGPIVFEAGRMRRPAPAIVTAEHRHRARMPARQRPAFVTVLIAMLAAIVTAVGAGLVRALRRVCRAANRLVAALAAWSTADALRAVATALGPAWPGNFRPAPPSAARIMK